MRIKIYALVIGLAVLAQSGCGYSLAGRGSFLPAYIKRIGVPQFTNNTSVFDLDRQVTENSSVAASTPSCRTTPASMAC